MLIILPNLSFAGTSVVAVDEFIADARQMNLAKQKAWLNLLHYKSTLFGARESQVDDTEFFLAENGAHDAQAELEADLRGFFSYKTSAHPRCLFPARLYWLNSKLNFLPQLSEMSCQKFNKWKNEFQADQVTLLFPGMFLDNPASMFGHTFLRFDRADNNHLLSNTLSYAAAYDETDPMLVYSWKGITGGYKGKFYIQAYFKTLQIYNDIEQRDIWEYPLNLNQQEIDQLIRHLWEVRVMDFDYFFFRENCAYRLLALLDVAREDINMSIDAHPLYAVPVDTVRDIEKAGLIDGHYYRPSTHNKISQMVDQISELASHTAIEIAGVSDMKVNYKQNIQDRIKNFPAEGQVRILLLADELLNQNQALSDNEKTLQLAILSARSRLALNQKQFEFSFNAVPPELSHKSTRWNLSAGSKRFENLDTQNFYEIGIRPAFHDFLDVSKGFIEGASISVLQTDLRWYQQQEKLKLQSLNFFSLQSVVPVKSWMKFGKIPLSRKLSLKLKQRDIKIDEQVLEFETQFSAGFATDVNRILMYALGTAQFEYATQLDKNHALYLGADFGGLWSFETGLFSGQTEINYQWLTQVSGEEGDVQKLNMGVQFNLIKNHALRIEYERTNYLLFNVDEAKLSYLMYF